MCTWGSSWGLGNWAQEEGPGPPRGQGASLPGGEQGGTGRGREVWEPSGPHTSATPLGLGGAVVLPPWGCEGWLLLGLGDTEEERGYPGLGHTSVVPNAQRGCRR